MANTLANRRAYFLSTKRTLTSISNETGIPKSTLSYVSRGLRNLPAKYNKTLRNYYQRTAYHLMREQRISVAQAHRFSWYTPERLQTVMLQFELKVKFLTEGYLASYDDLLKSGKASIEAIPKWYEAEEKMREALEKSPETYERILAYGERSE